MVHKRSKWKNDSASLSMEESFITLYKAHTFFLEQKSLGHSIIVEYQASLWQNQADKT